MIENNVLKKNKVAWNMIADDWFGSTALPTYAPLMKDETELNLFENIKGKKVLDIGCGSGHSLKYMGDNGAAELWGLDMSSKQIENASEYLRACGYDTNLFEAPMEINPGIPTNYFDIVYSIYAFGWTVNLEKSLELVSKYLKPGGMFVFSWDHPILPCLDVKNEKIVFSKSYHDTNRFTLSKAGHEMYLTKWKLSSYLEGFKKAGLYLDTLIEEVDENVFAEKNDDLDKYYSKDKSKLLPLSIIIKAIKKLD